MFHDQILQLGHLLWESVDTCAANPFESSCPRGRAGSWQAKEDETGGEKGLCAALARPLSAADPRPAPSFLAAGATRAGRTHRK